MSLSLTEDAAVAALERRRDIDNLRNLLILALVVFHTARLFDPEPWSVKDAIAPQQWAFWIVSVLNAFQMPLFFVLAGASAFYSIRARGYENFAKERVLRIVVPLIFGILVFVPPQIYIESIATFVKLRYHDWSFSGNFFEFYPTLFGEAKKYDWNHLWFLSFLFTYAVLIGPFLNPRGKEEAIRRWGGFFSRHLMILILPTVALVFVEVVLYRVFPSDHNPLRGWADHIRFGLEFSLGWLIAASPALREAVTRRSLTLAAIAGAFMLVIYCWPIWHMLGVDWKTSLVYRRLIYVVAEWPSVIALLGLAQRFLNRPFPFFTWFTRYELPFYILHQTVIICLGYALYAWAIDPVLKFFVLCALTVALSLLGAVLLDTNPVTRIMVGLKPPSTDIKSPTEKKRQFVDNSAG